jgi:DNA-binding transcriptional regulator YiaG
MSINSELLARLERLGPVRVESRRPLSSDEGETVLLRCRPDVGALIPVAHRLREVGLTLKLAHTAITELAAQNWTVCLVDRTADFGALAADLRAMKVALHRRRVVEHPAAVITAIREHHKLSQREFADRLGLDVRTLQNWEQGRNRPDPAALSLMRLFDEAPELVEQAVFEAVP